MIALTVVNVDASPIPRFSVGASGGVVVPLGKFADKAQGDSKAGPLAGLCIEYNASDSWSFGVDGAWASNAQNLQGTTEDLGNGDFVTFDEAKFTTIRYGAHAKYWIPSKGDAIRTYGQLSAGAYRQRYKFRDHGSFFGFALADTTESDPITDIGLALGTGAEWRVAEAFSVRLEGNFHQVFESGGSLQFVDLTGGVYWRFKMK